VQIEQKTKENSFFIKKIWKIREKILPLQRQNIRFGYPGRIPRRQDFMTPP